MKNISKHKKILMLIASILSPMMYVALGMFLPRISYAEGMLHIDDGDPDDMDKILSYSVSNPLLLIPAIISIIVIIVNISIAAYLIATGKTKIEKHFGYFTTIVGGLGFNSIYLLVKTFKNKTKEVVSTRGKFLMTTGVIAVPLAITPIFAMAFYSGVDKPTEVGVMKFSTDPNHKNVIEIFTDGFDPKLMSPKLNGDKNLEGFKMLDKYVVSGAETSFSFPTIMGGIEDYNIYQQKDGGSSSNMVELYASIFANSVVGHLMNDMKTKNSNSKRPRYFINTNSMGQSASFQESMSGHPEGIYKANEHYIYNGTHGNVQPVNYGQAKNIVTGKFGSANYSPEEMYYQFTMKHSKVDNNPIAGTRFMMQEFITHSPRVSGDNGQLTLNMSNGSIDRAANALKWSLDSVMNNFKHMVGTNGKSVYDNSLIIVYGDHSNHQNPLAHSKAWEDKTGRKPLTYNMEKWHSFAMIKYPDQKAAISHIKNRVVYAPYMNNIIEHFYDNSDDPSFIETDPHFDGSKRLLGFFGNEAAYMHFEKHGTDTEEKLYPSAISEPAGVDTENGWLIYDNKDYPGHKDYVHGLKKDQSKLLEGVIW